MESSAEPQINSPVPASLEPNPAPATSDTPVVTSKPRRGRTLVYAAAAVALLLGIVLAGRFFFTPKAGAGSSSFASGLLALFDRADVTEVRVFPGEVNLGAKQDRQSVVVQAVYADGATRDVTAGASFSLGNKALARLENCTLYPIENGKTELQVKFSGKIAENSGDGRTRQSGAADQLQVGCDPRADEGRLQLRRVATVPRAARMDFASRSSATILTAIITASRASKMGRRINLALPEESLLIEKGLGAVPHTGGERFKKGERDLQTPSCAGCRPARPKTRPTSPKSSASTSCPSRPCSKGRGSAQKFTVRAKYSDGTDRDVTSLAVFISNNEPVAKVSEDGLVTAGQRGESFVMARFDTFTVGSQMIVVPKDLPYEFPKDVAEYNYIDTLVHAKLKKLRITPSGLCDDATFLRRVYLDITGTSADRGGDAEVCRRTERRQARPADRRVARSQGVRRTVGDEVGGAAPDSFAPGSVQLQSRAALLQLAAGQDARTTCRSTKSCRTSLPLPAARSGTPPPIIFRSRPTR